MNILDAISDPKVFAHCFRDKGTWAAWFVFLAALFALPMSAEQLAIYQACTGRAAPVARAVEAWLVCGRRAGKSFTLALIAVFLACFSDWRPFLGPGECATIMIIAADRRQARTIIRYVKGLLKSVPMLAQTVESETAQVDNPRQPRRHRGPILQLPGGARLHSRRVPRRRDRVLDDRRGRRQSRLRGPERHPPGDGHGPRLPCCCVRHRPTRAEARCGKRITRHYGQAMARWSGRRQRGDEPDREPGLHRRRDGEGPVSGRRRVLALSSGPTSRASSRARRSRRVTTGVCLNADPSTVAAMSRLLIPSGGICRQLHACHRSQGGRDRHP